MTRTLWRMESAANAGDRGAIKRFDRPKAGLSSFGPGGATPELLARAPDGSCPECRTPVPVPQRVQPLSVVWPRDEPADPGDFMWPAGTHLPVVRRATAEALRERFTGFEPGPVADHPGLAELWVTATVQPDPRSTLRPLIPPCPVCGYRNLFWGGGSVMEVALRWRKGLVQLEGVEFWDTGNWDPAVKDLAQIHHPRRPGAGLLVSERELAGHDLFFVGEDRKFVLCTDAVKAFVERRGYSNVGFLAAGEQVA